MASPLIANRKIAAEEFDGETVLINVEKGLYFSLQGPAIDLWRTFATGHRRGAVVEAFSVQGSGADRAALETVIELMQQHDLLIACKADPAGIEQPVRLPSRTPGAPVLEVFSDLAELIAIDPVHEVDAASGWPVRPPNFPDVA